MTETTISTEAIIKEKKEAKNKAGGRMERRKGVKKVDMP